jgi:hypothetical protein
MTTIGHVFIPLDREHDGVVPTGEDRAHFESLPVPLALWQSFEACLSDHLSDYRRGRSTATRNSGSKRRMSMR